ncbi:hypothetical protein SS50377_22500 [Spironucleus salmonicida]|uniref:Uncharacterized protein n=1 Tax=Spironucleus salmonicida TaxID=348837 RepID=V6LMQ9_9EUKA|nr:hypothetical protein SS50377_22500 [Spironucleus salmonicida]|eukprot:EST42009.1 Hypothetical protein SS50377_18315 [Spironucleus salmonicida]
MDTIKKIYYTDQSVLASLLTSDTALTLLTNKTIEYHNANQENPLKIILQIPVNHSIVQARFFPRPGQVEILLAILKADNNQFLVILEIGNGKIQFSTPSYQQITDFNYIGNSAFYVADNIIYSWDIQIQPEIFYKGTGKINNIQFAEILFKQHVIICSDDKVFTIEADTKRQALDFNITGKIRLMCFNSFINQIFIQTIDGPFFIFDLNTTLTFNLQPPILNYSYSGNYRLNKVLPTESGYIVTCCNGLIYNLEVVYESPCADLTQIEKIVINQAGFQLVIKGAKVLFNSQIKFLGLSRISNDYFFVGTENCIICGKVSSINTCDDDYIGLGVTKRQNDLIKKTRISLMKSDDAQYKEFIDNLLTYKLGHVSELFKNQYIMLCKDLYHIVQYYSFTENHDLVQTIDSPWADLDNQIQQKPFSDDDQFIALNPFYPQEQFRIMLNSESQQNDLDTFIDLTLQQFSSDPIVSSQKMQLSAYAKNYFPHLTAIIYRISKQFNEGLVKLNQFKQNMQHQSQFLADNFKKLNQNETDLSLKTEQSRILLEKYVASYYHEKLQKFDLLSNEPSNIRNLIKFILPLYLKSEVSTKLSKTQLLSAFSKSLNVLIENFTASTPQNLSLDGKNAVSETILDQNHSIFHQNLTRLNIGYGKIEKFAFQPLPANSISFHFTEIDQNLVNLLKEINAQNNQMRQISNEYLIFDDFLVPYVIYDFIELFSATNLLFMVSDQLKNTSQEIFNAIQYTNKQFKGKFQLLELYDIRPYEQNDQYSKLYFKKAENIFRLSDIITNQTQDLSWQNPHKKFIPRPQNLQDTLEKMQFGMKQIKRIIANLAEFLNFVQTQEVAVNGLENGKFRSYGGIDPTQVFVDLITLEVHVLFVFENTDSLKIDNNRIVMGACFQAPELIFGVRQPSSDVWSLALLFLCLYHSFVAVPKQKKMKRADIKSFAQIIFNFNYFVHLTSKIAADNFNFKSKNSKQREMPTPLQTVILAVLTASASLSTDITDLPQQQQISKILKVLMSGSSQQVSNMQDYFTKAISQPFINPGQNGEAKELFSYNKGKMFKFIELTEKYIQNIIKKCLVFNSDERMSISEFLSLWKCEGDDVLQQELVLSKDIQNISESNQKVMQYQLQVKIEISSGEDLSVTNEEDVEDEEEDFSDQLEKINAEMSYSGSQQVEEEIDEENFEEMTEGEIKEIKEKKQYNSQLEAFREIYIQQYGEVPGDLDLEALMKHSIADQEDPNLEEIAGLETSDIYKADDMNYYQDIIDNPDKFKEVEVPVVAEDVEKVNQPQIKGVMSQMKPEYDVYAMQDELVEEYNMPSDYEPEKSEEVEQAEELPWYVLAAQQEEKEKQEKASTKLTRKQKIQQRDKKVASGEQESDDYTYEDDEEEEEADHEEEKTEISKTEKQEKDDEPQFNYENSDKPIWETAEGDQEKEVFYDENGEVIDMNIGDMNIEQEILIDDDGMAYYINEEGEKQYLE